MSDVKEVIDAAQRLSAKDDSSLEVLIGMREEAIKRDPGLSDNVYFEPKYDANTMGGLDEIKALGKRVLGRWNKELYGVVCGGEATDQKDRKAVLDSLNLGEAAVVAAVAGALLGLGVAAAIAAAVAPLIVRRFVWPAKDELCGAWAEGIKAQG
jgi:hypothetical protein